ncbi:hypothetical protein BKA63DRAFT_495053 [Paraphoma chrysanthemicola]|nr:hypothetical protein BKA63DRAFT_495053 [Paraphoma chrysanthemicola]
MPPAFPRLADWLPFITKSTTAAIFPSSPRSQAFSEMARRAVAAAVPPDVTYSLITQGMVIRTRLVVRAVNTLDFDDLGRFLSHLRRCKERPESILRSNFAISIPYDSSSSPGETTPENTYRGKTTPTNPLSRPTAAPAEATNSASQLPTAPLRVHLGRMTWGEVVARWRRESAPEPESRPRITPTPALEQAIAPEVTIRRVYTRPEQVVPGGPYVNSYDQILYQDRAGHEHERPGEGRRRPWDVPITHAARQRAARNLRGGPQQKFRRAI